MANKKGGLREAQKIARSIAAQALRNMQTAAPEHVALWRREWQEAQAEVRRLQRELTS